MTREEILEQMAALRKKLAEGENEAEDDNVLGGEKLVENEKKPIIEIPIDDCNKNDFLLQGSVLLKYTGKDNDVVVPAGVTKICDSAFSGAWIKSVYIPQTVSIIGKRAFHNCQFLECVVLCNGLKEIGEEAFVDCHGSLLNIVIPDSVTQIGNGAFGGCSKLKSITLSKNIKIIGERTFADCKELKSIVVPDGVAEIGGRAFSYCKSLESLTLPKNLKVIGKMAFNDCSMLKNIVIPDGCKQIEDYAFDCCEKLESLVIPKSVKKIGERIAKNCPKVRIYCEEKKKPSGWDKNWHDMEKDWQGNPTRTYKNTVWGYKN